MKRFQAKYNCIKKGCYLDEGISGRQAEKRPAFMRMIGLAKTEPRPFDVILVHKFDRFARSREDSIVYKSMLRRECGISVVSITEHIEDDKFAVILEAMLEAMAEYYSINLAEEVKKGMTEKARRGEYQARAPFGYRLEDGRLRPQEAQAAIVRQMYQEYLNGASFFALARQLNSRGIRTLRGNLRENRTVKYILQNPVYKGYVRWNPEGKLDLRQHRYQSGNFIVARGNHEPIVSIEQWEAVNRKILSERRGSRRRPPETMRHWLGGLLRCSNCGGLLASGGAGGYQCMNYSKGKCKISHFIQYDKAGLCAQETLRPFAEDRGFSYASPPRPDNPAATLELKAQLKLLEARAARARDAYLNGIDTMEEYRRNRNIFQKEQEQLQKEINALEDIRAEDDRDEKHRRISSVYDLICSSADTAKKNTALREIVDHIVYDRQTETMDFYFSFRQAPAGKILRKTAD